MDIYKTITWTIFCNFCGDHFEYSPLCGGGTKENAKQYFKKIGWREMDGETLCPECIKKTLAEKE